MKTFNLAIATIALAAAASTSAFAAATDSNGNIPNHNSDAVTSYNDSATYNDPIFGTAPSNNQDALFVQLKNNTDKNWDRN